MCHIIVYPKIITITASVKENPYSDNYTSSFRIGSQYHTLRVETDIDSGIDFPNLVLKSAFPKLEINFPLELNKKIYCRWLFLGDILWVLTHPKKVKAFKKFLNFKNQKFDILDFTDPMPVIGSVIEGLISLFSIERKKHAFDRGW